MVLETLEFMIRVCLIYDCQLPPGTRITDGEVVTDTSDPFAILEQIDGVDDDIRKKTYRELHDLCELPIIHEGDLRASILISVLPEIVEEKPHLIISSIT